MDFTQFYRLLHNREPFLWQRELAEALVANHWEDALIVPCGGGKTAVLEIWLHSLYQNIVSGTTRFMPLRLYYIVDRKVIVDSSHSLAMKLRDSLCRPEFATVAEVLKAHFGVAEALVVGRMRGGLDRAEKNQWITVPNQPTIVMSTIDQYGSRLLFRGYGISPWLRSIHAGLAVVDSLLAMDESHLAQALRQTVTDVMTMGVPGVLGDVPQTRVLELSATSTSKKFYQLTINNDAMLQQRLSVRRPVKLVAADRLVPTLASLAHQAPQEVPGATLIGVVCNSVKTARAVHKVLRAQGKSVLLIGRIRHWERRKLSEKYFADLLVDSRKRGREAEVTYVVSTQTIEVGADIDFDVLVTEAAPLDNLIQRFGRLDRVGRFGKSQGYVVYNKKQDKDYIYGDRTKETYEYLLDKYPQGDIPNIGDVPVDPGLYAKTPRITRLTQMATLRLAHTYPDIPVDVDAYLHGVQPSNLEFNLVYRSEINGAMLKADKKRQEKGQVTFSSQWLRLASPRIAEMVTLPIRAFHDKDAADTMYATGTDDAKEAFATQLCVRYSDFAVIEIDKIKPGDTVFVPCEFGQHDEFGWVYEERPNYVDDVYDLVADRVLRVHSAWFPAFSLARYVGDDEELALPQLLAELWDKIPEAPRGKRARKKLQRWREGDYEVHRSQPTPDGKGVYVYFRDRKKPGVGRQGLFEHNDRVSALAERFAKAIGLKSEFCEILAVAGRYHDLGKADSRFQDDLYYPLPRVPHMLLAKSDGGSVGKRPRRLPRGWRHELQSVVIMEENGLGKEVADVGLLYHLVASHHGYSRNTFPLVEDLAFESFEVGDSLAISPYFTHLAAKDRELFHALNRRYGFWGLAYLEAILRLADWKGSTADV